jgi:O-antigen ligase
MKTMQNVRLRFEDFLLLLMLAFPTLLAEHEAPQAVFYSEWAAALGLVLLLLVRAFAREALSLSPSLVLLWLGFAVAAFWPREWGLTGPGNAFGYVLYAGMFVLAASLARGVDVERSGSLIAGGLFLCALMQSIVAAFQLFDLELGGLVLKKAYAAVYGNVGQSNHFADLCWLGLAGLLYLFGSGTLRRPALVLFAVWLNLMVAACASRGAWLYTGLFIVCAIWLWARRREHAAAQRLWPAAIVIVVASIAAQLAASLGLFEHFGLLSAAGRLAAHESNGQRLHDWHVALGAIAAHPWLGAGPGAFYSLTVESAIAGPQQVFPMLGENAHNLLLQLGAELGLPLVALIVVLGFVWLVRNLLAAPTLERVLALTGLGIVVLHGMVEYPFWYSYLVIPAGLCWGLGEAGEVRRLRLALPRAVVAGVAIVGVWLLAWALHDWVAIRSARIALDADDMQWSEPELAETRRALAAVSDWSLFADQARIQSIQAWKPERATAAALARACDGQWRVLPDWTAMIQCANAYSSVGNEAELDRVMVTLCRGFPSYHKLLREWIAREPDLGGPRPDSRACLAH